MGPEEVFKFCPRCQADLVFADNNVKCAKCGLVHYINPIPCNAVIITNDKAEILLVERKTEPFAGKWDLPGGFISLGENLEESMRREAREELCIELEDLKYFQSSHDKYLYRGVCDFTIGFIFTAKIVKGGEICASDDAKSYRFFKKTELPWDDIAFFSIRNALKAFLINLDS